MPATHALQLAAKVISTTERKTLLAHADALHLAWDSILENEGAKVASMAAKAAEGYRPDGQQIPADDVASRLENTRLAQLRVSQAATLYESARAIEFKSLKSMSEPARRVIGAAIAELDKALAAPPSIPNPEAYTTWNVKVDIRHCFIQALGKERETLKWEFENFHRSQDVDAYHWLVRAGVLPQR